MQSEIYTVEELMLNDSFFSYCLDKQSPGKEFWEKEIKLHSDQKAIFEEARYMINLLHGKLDDQEINRQVEKIKKLIGNQEEKHLSEEKSQKPISLQPGISNQYRKSAKNSGKKYLLYGIALSVLVFLGAYLFKSTSSKVNPLRPPIDVSYNSGMGEHKTIRLPDSSVAVLNSNSRITLAGDYNKNERSVILSGEAFFQVAKNPAKPFIVHSGAFSVTALGTSFYVQAGDLGNNCKVDLLEGKVRLAQNKNKTTGPGVSETILLPGEEGAWQFSTMSFTKTSCDSTLLKKWVSGKLSFKNMAVEKVLELLRQWYVVEITVKHKKWAKLTLTGDYDNKPLDHVLKIICFSLSADYSYSGNRVIIE